MAVKKGDKVQVDYTGTLEDGTVFDSSENHGVPLEFEVGAEQVIKGFDDALIGMKSGDEKEVTIQPSEGYGEINPELVKAFPREQFPTEQKIEEGMVFGISLPNGMQVPVVVKGVSEKEITIDLNPPLAGKVLKFKIKLVGISS